MIDFPINEIPIAQEIVRHETQLSNAEDYYQLLEVDLSFSNALAGLCSGESSSGPVKRPKGEKKLR